MSREWVDCRGLSKGLNMIFLKKCHIDAEWGVDVRGRDPGKWEIRQLLQPPRASLAGAEEWSPFTIYYATLRRSMCHTLKFMHKDLSGNGAPLQSSFPPQEHCEHSVQHAVCKIQRILLLKRRHEKIWLVSRDAVLEIPTQGHWRWVKWCPKLQHNRKEKSLHKDQFCIRNINHKRITT